MTDPNNGGTAPPDLTPTLVIQLREGNSAAARLLDQLYRPRLTRFCLGYLGRWDEAEDVVQDVFYRVLTSSTIPERFRAWIYEISRNRCLDILRGRNHKLDDQPLPTSSYIAAQMTGGLTKLIKGEKHARLRERLATLSVEQYEVLLLRYMEGLSRGEISDILGIPENLVKHRIYNGIEKLRRHQSLADEN